MSWLFYLLAIGFVAWLWRRVVILEREVARLRDGVAAVPSTPAFTPSPSVDAAPRLGLEPTPLPAAQAQKPVQTSLGSRAGDALAWRPSLDLEDLFGRRLPIWAGGVTLAVAGFFLVRWSIDAGLLTPAVRVLLAGLFGAALIAGAEVAYRWRERVADPRVAQTLAGAGLATLYAACYLAGSAYGLIGSTLAFLGLAAVTGAAIALSYRFGLPSAVLGLVGGFAAPALVGSDQANVPLLTLYLALVTAGLALTGKRQDRAWLGVAALAGGLGWGALLMAGGIRQPPDAAVLGAYLVLLGAIVPGLTGVAAARPHWLVRVGAAALAALQLAFLVQQSGFGALEWSLYLLLGGALAWFGWRQPAMREANAAAAGVGAALLLFWPTPDPWGFAFVAAALAIIFAGVPLAQVARGQGRPLDLAQAALFALAVALAVLWHFGTVLPDDPQPLIALVSLSLAGIAALAVALAPRLPGTQGGHALLTAQAVAALLGFGALAQVLPQDALAFTGALAAALLAWRLPGLRGAIATLALIALGWALAPLSQWLQVGWMALVGEPMQTGALPALRAMLLHIVPAAAAWAAWWVVLPSDKAELRKGIAAIAIGLAAVAGHVVFRHVFASVAGTDFVATGVAERMVWEALLLASAWLAARRGWRRAAVGLAASALTHFAWFSLTLHNPLWSAQAVGPLPLANALLPAYAVGCAGLLLLRRWLGETAFMRWLVDAALMMVIALFALSELRQMFAGSLMVATPVSPTEDLLRSLLGIALAAGFLAWGAHTHERSWRIGSLVLMVIAVLKVFLVDAAGLAGLARIASFMALGFSLIGIGWFYSRQLRASPAETAATAEA
ncbi:DUF2339 domain-containing protein [Parafrankia sp. BMG5.11]|uniref:DUF2339 domain-containing protein n=1 Tax=Parafrankia sp. BMG5.11 TaxID=222540 RepID=UPI001039A396|nr:DUF2339 domain-containing protein [Parafrankia sp. BMG5.11]TCJ41480.1 DUF2339 domain-containing protein [Parafrankia sp. BMG5.11]